MKNNIIPLRPKISQPAPSFDQLTARLVLAKHERGELPAGVVAALLSAVGLKP